MGMSLRVSLIFAFAKGVPGTTLIHIELLEDGSGLTKSDLKGTVFPKRKTDEGYVLHPIEIAYLLFTGKGIAFYKEKELSFIDYIGWVLRKLEGCNCPLERTFWSMFTVYYDLRKRNRKVLVEVRRDGTLIEVRRDKWWTEYLVLEEGIVITVNDLLEWVEEVRANDLRGVVAVVDRNGSVTYYEASKVYLKGPDRPSVIDLLSSIS
ncbi:endonuclease [Ignicoccus islandicus DSM 13165]|uniref:Endonuclease n=2 Tax=Ignicoccus islandicus TaxID=54259 RepID=A0A0U3DWF1_9CREN|nr:endonuclease [Ignicoccus islandicus DSM 13165]